jgi:hypothetical protein
MIPGEGMALLGAIPSPWQFSLRENCRTPNLASQNRARLISLRENCRTPNLASQNCCTASRRHKFVSHRLHTHLVGDAESGKSFAITRIVGHCMKKSREAQDGKISRVLPAKRIAYYSQAEALFAEGNDARSVTVDSRDARQSSLAHFICETAN